MNSYDTFATPKGPTRWLLWSLVVIFLTTLIAFTIIEVRSLNDNEPSVIRIVLNAIHQHRKGGNHSEESSQAENIVLLNVATVQQDGEELVKADVSEVEENSADLERKTREAANNATTNINKNSYYEEQTPVVVYSKTETDPPLSYRQSAPVPYQQGSHEEQPYYGGEGEENEDYANSDNEGYYRPQYDDDSREDFSAPQDYANDQEADEARSAQERQYDAYYRQWHYATPAPSAVSASRSTSLTSPSKTGSQGNRKSQTMTASPATGGVRDPYAAYVDDYDYMPPNRAPARPQHYQQQQQVQRYRPPASTQAVQKKEDESQEMNLLSILKTLKMMWDLYQSFASAWNSMAEQRNKQEELAEQKLKQQQQKSRINSKKPPAINSKNKPVNPTKNPKKPKQTTTGPTTTTTTTEPSISTSTEEEAEDVEIVKTQKLQKAKVEPRKGFKGDITPTKDAEGLRKKREANDNTAVQTTDVAEGRYIKGDPLKGYYDFVITEGSYKFWAVFQVGTALLIIYSTFAAIYYSKVNPLVSDYDYTDYLGGGRSLSGGDLDFVDDETAEGSQPYGGAQQSKGWLGWLPRTGHSLKFILDAIDKLPVDHAVSRDEGGGYGADAGEEEKDDANAGDIVKDLSESTKNKAM